MKAQRKPEPLSWEAVRCGPVYCAPACGRGCTFKAFDRATKVAGEVCAKLGDGWMPHVWENLGWHCSVISPCGRIEVHIGKGFISNRTDYDWEPRGYTAYIESGSRFTGDGRTPQIAVSRLVAQVKQEAAYWAALVAGL